MVFREWSVQISEGILETGSTKDWNLQNESWGSFLFASELPADVEV